MTRTKSRRIKILLVDDHPLVREGIRSCLIAHSHLDIIGEAADGEEAIGKTLTLRPDVVLMDITLPRMNGLEATQVLSRQAHWAKVLVLTVHNNREYLIQIVRSGARGYLLKDASPSTLVHAIEAVHSGKNYYSTEISQMVVNELMATEDQADQPLVENLTHREREVLASIADGLSNKDIARRLGDVSVRTVESHRERIKRKLNIHTVAGLTKFALSHGLLAEQRSRKQRAGR